MTEGRIYIGTSGWHYDHWTGPFYPADLKSGERLAYYARHFRAAEINNSFYQLPGEETFTAWRDTVGEDFLFAVKASRYITHMKKLKDPEQPVAHFLDRVTALGGCLGPVLFQLPPRWHANLARLEAFLASLPAGRYSFEFRDRSWFEPPVIDLLRRAGAALCIYQLAGFRSPKEVTADFVYIRLHGPDGAYQGCYDTQTLAGWAGAISTWRRQGLDVYVFFDNDQQGFAVKNALSLQKMLE